MLSKSLLKTLVMFGAPISYIAIGAVHPMELKVGDDAGLYIAIHIIQLFSIWGMALTLWWLVEGIENRAATIARAAILPYAIAYTALDAIAGIALGTTVHAANTAPAADQEAARRLFEDLYMGGATIEGMALFLAASLLWLLAAGSAALAHRGRAPTGAVVLMVVGAAIFTVGHPFPPGPIGMALFLAGLAWLRLREVPVAEPDANAAPARPVLEPGTV
jgi:hypothetical protein